MSESFWNSVWERARTGATTLLLNVSTVPAAPSDLKMVRVSGDACNTPGGLLEEACTRIARLLGEDPQAGQSAAGRSIPGLRHRLLQQVPLRSIDARLVDLCNKLADWSDGQAILVLERIDQAETSTIETLLQILRRPDWLRLPLILTLSGKPQGAMPAVADFLRGEHGEAAVMDCPSTPPVAPAQDHFDWSVLPSPVLRVLRAGAVMGSSFEADLIARLLDETPGTVLLQLQTAADAGAPLADRGEGRFSLPPAAVADLQARILPSLLQFWHARLGELLSSRPTVPPTTEPVKQAAPISTAAEPQTVHYQEMFDAPEPSSRLQDVDNTPPTPGQARPLPTGSATTQAAHDPARAAAHLQAAGDQDAAIERYLDAVRDAGAHGDALRAFKLAQEGLHLLDSVPNSKPRALLRAHLLLETARLQWQGTTPDGNAGLQQALQTVAAARECVADSAPAELLAEIAGLNAGICYDLGDLQSLQASLSELTAVSQALLQAGQAVMAARLLNDQAAIQVRLGDPVRAAHLLSQAQRLFENLLQQQPDDSTGLRELAETRHLLARLPLHAQLRPGRETDAYRQGLEHCSAAAEVYEKLGQRRELAHVWETMGRLELRRNRLQEAGQRFSAALELQRSIGDVNGLARSTAAFADWFIATGKVPEATALLSDSIALNRQQGSPIGLAFNRQTLGVLARAVQAHSGAQNPTLVKQLQALEQQLIQAEHRFGRAVLPGERA